MIKHISAFLSELTQNMFHAFKVVKSDLNIATVVSTVTCANKSEFDFRFVTIL